MCVDRLKVSTLLVISLLIVHFTVVLIIVFIVVFACSQYGSCRRQRIITDGSDSYSRHQGSGKYTVLLYVQNVHIAYEESD